MVSFYDTGPAKELKNTQTHGWTGRIAPRGTLAKLAGYLPLLVPIILFVVSLFTPPQMVPDSGVGFFALRSMFEGGAFNSVTTPDPTNIAKDVVTFLTLWSPGQYLVPGTFIWLGTDYGLALSLTTLVATLIGVIGWIHVARSFAVSFFVLFVFVLGLNTFYYVTMPFRVYHGGEVLLFAVAPWSLYAMRWAAHKPPPLCLAISILSLALLFFAKLTGLIVFATNVVAISLLALVSQRRLSASTISMWVASAVGAFCFIFFWVARGPVAASGSTFAFSWLPIWFSVTCSTFSGISILIFLEWFLGHPWVQTIFGFAWVTDWEPLLCYVLGPLGVLLLVSVWFRLRHTRYRNMAALSLTIISLYAIAIAVMYLRGASISFEDRHFRYAGILFFLLLLTVVDQWRARFAKGLACVAVVVLGLFGIKCSATDAYAQMRAGHYDPMTGITQDFVSPAVLEYMRSEVIRQNFQRPIAVIPSPSAAISLPRFRILYIGVPIAAQTWAGRAEKIFVVVQGEMLLNGKAEALLRSFTGYEYDNWKQITLDGMIIYTQ
jgi:hypothetical protein